jgi:hypothetical protein
MFGAAGVGVASTASLYVFASVFCLPTLCVDVSVTSASFALVASFVFRGAFVA